jgi:hypothetical protein
MANVILRESDMKAAPPWKQKLASGESRRIGERFSVGLLRNCGRSAIKKKDGISAGWTLS